MLQNLSQIAHDSFTISNTQLGKQIKTIGHYLEMGIILSLDDNQKRLKQVIDK